MDPIYVTGHRNPDTDSIVAAISYAALRNAIGDREYEAACLGRVSDETRLVLDNVSRAKVRGYKVIAFTRAAQSTLAKQADITFLVDPDEGQLLLGHMPNTFFGKVILAFEALLGRYLAEAGQQTETFTQM